MRLLITGGAGFAGAHIVEHFHKNTDWEITVLDRLSYAGTLERLSRYKDDPRFRYVFHDFRAPFSAPVLHLLEGTDYVIHNGGETHVERSLQDPIPFVMSNVLGTTNVLNACRNLGVKHVIYISTDEVHGPAPDGTDFQEDAPIKPSNPYSATKAGAEAMAYAYWKAYGLPVTITRTMNMFGERQHPEKYIPMCIRNILHGRKVTVHGCSDGSLSSRKWLHARNQADALLFLLTARPEYSYTKYEIQGQTFHVAGDEHTTLEIAQYVAQALEHELTYEIVDYHTQRPGHDRRYSLDDSKLRSLGWAPPVPFEESLRRTVEWTVKPENQKWLAE